MDYLPSNITDCVTEAGLALEKSRIILGDLAARFPFDNKDNKKKQEWAWEYESITAYMDMAFDYVHEAIQKLERARGIEDKARNEKASVVEVGVVA